MLPGVTADIAFPGFKFFTLDVSPLRQREGKVFVGVEWQLWRNKDGVRGLDARAPQALILWSL